MKRKRADTALTLILIFLIAASIAQAGLLWTNQTYGNATGRLAESSVMNDKTVIDEVFKPYNIILSAGSGEDKLIISPANKDYADLWSEALLYLRAAYSTKSTTMNIEGWIGLYSRSSVIFEFKTNIRTEILAWFLGVNKLPSNEMTGLYKMALSIDEDNTGKMVVYILDDTEAHVFVMPFKNRDRKYFTGVMIENFASQDNIHYRLAPRNIILNTRDDLLVTSGVKDLMARFGTLLVKAPDITRMSGSDSQLYQRNVANALLSSERYSYETDMTKDGTLTIANLNNIYSLDNNGYLEYEAKTPQDEIIAKGNVKDAFINALKFIYENKRRSLTSQVNLYISDIIENKGSYTFVLDYRVSGMIMVPIYIDYKTAINGNEVKVDDAIRIVSTGSGVLSAKWLMRQVEKLPGEVEMMILPDIPAMNNLIQANYPKLFAEDDSAEIQQKQTILNELNLAYIITTISKPMGMTPVWVIVTNLDTSRYLYMEEAN